MFSIIQKSLFPEFEDEVIADQKTLCLKCFDDPTFCVDINVADESTPEEVALKKLGYFLIAKNA